MPEFREHATERSPLTLELLPGGSWKTDLSGPPRVMIEQIDFSLAAPRIVTIPIAKPRVRCASYSFAPQAASVVLAIENRSTAAAVAAASAARRPTTGKPAARIKPPHDVVKLKDRLFYLLQPSIEFLLKSESLEMPSEPFTYQLEGIGFLYPRHAAVLADEMGLGKTMQAITAIRLLFHAAEIRSVLLICPKPLITNWQRELAAWAPEIPVVVIGGSRHQRSWQWQRDDVPIRIANYELLVRDACAVDEGVVTTDLLVLDEAQRIKNAASCTNKVVCGIERTRSWALTGTPIENSGDDLVGIFEFLSPGLLRRDMPPRHMARAVGDYVLRRTKEQVLTELPPKMFRDAELELTPEQAATYDLAENEGVVRLNELGDRVTIQHVFELVLRLKQICNFDPATGSSCKLERLLADLEEVAASGHKAIVFSQWVATLKVLAEKLRRFRPLEYHGRIPAAQRDPIVDRFRNESRHSVILMSYGAGSVGLNLQFTNYVFLFDRWWNPAVEDQAINRAHRIGVSGPVTVTRFLTRGTIEERIEQVLSHKRGLLDTILGAAGVPRDLGLSREEVFGLFPLNVRSKAA